MADATQRIGRFPGGGGEIGDLEELLNTMPEARNDLKKEKKAMDVVQEEKESKKSGLAETLWNDTVSTSVPGVVAVGRRMDLRRVLSRVA